MISVNGKPIPRFVVRCVSRIALTAAIDIWASEIWPI